MSNRSCWLWKIIQKHHSAGVFNNSKYTLTLKFHWENSKEMAQSGTTHLLPSPFFSVIILFPAHVYRSWFALKVQSSHPELLFFCWILIILLRDLSFDIWLWSLTILLWCLWSSSIQLYIRTFVACNSRQVHIAGCLSL